MATTLKNSCVQCRQTKNKCSRTLPCERCVKQGLDCEPQAPERSGRRKANPPPPPHATSSIPPTQTFHPSQQQQMHPSVPSTRPQQWYGIATAMPDFNPGFPHTQPPLKVARVAYAPSFSPTSATYTSAPASHLAFCPPDTSGAAITGFWGPEDEATAHRAMMVVAHVLHSNGQLDSYRTMCTMNAWASESQKRGYDITRGLHGYLSALLSQTAHTQHAAPYEDPNATQTDVEVVGKGVEVPQKTLPSFARALDDGCSAFCGYVCVGEGGDDGGRGGSRFEYVCNNVCTRLYMTVNEMMQGFQNTAVVPLVVWGSIITAEDRPSFFTTMATHMLSRPYKGKEDTMLVKCYDRHGTCRLCLARMRYIVMRNGQYTCLVLSLTPLPSQPPHIDNPFARAPVKEAWQGWAAGAVSGDVSDAGVQTMKQQQPRASEAQQQQQQHQQHVVEQRVLSHSSSPRQQEPLLRQQQYMAELRSEEQQQQPYAPRKDQEQPQQQQHTTHEKQQYVAEQQQWSCGDDRGGYVMEAASRSAADCRGVVGVDRDDVAPQAISSTVSAQPPLPAPQQQQQQQEEQQHEQSQREDVGQGLSTEDGGSHQQPQTHTMQPGSSLPHFTGSHDQHLGGGDDRPGSSSTTDPSATFTQIFNNHGLSGVGGAAAGDGGYGGWAEYARGLYVAQPLHTDHAMGVGMSGVPEVAGDGGQQQQQQHTESFLPQDQQSYVHHHHPAQHQQPPQQCPAHAPNMPASSNMPASDVKGGTESKGSAKTADSSTMAPYSTTATTDTGPASVPSHASHAAAAAHGIGSAASHAGTAAATAYQSSSPSYMVDSPAWLPAASPAAHVQPQNAHYSYASPYSHDQQQQQVVEPSGAFTPSPEDAPDAGSE